MTDSDLRQKLAAILAADVAGYSRMMSADERATVAALDAARAVFRGQIEANAGRVIDMAGDAVLAVFETAAGAVTSALAVQQALADAAKDLPDDRRMRFRIGVHLGDVIEKADGTVYGDGVNIAARLESLAEPGGITVSDAVHGAVRGKVGASFADQGEQQVKNIAYPVRAYRLKIGAETGQKQAPAAGGIDLSLPDKPSIAVLAFANMSGDPEQEYFTDGVAEDIITELSRFKSLFVIARNSSFSYKGKTPDIRQVGKELGVRYVLEGSVRRTGNRIRVTAQLIDSLGGSHLWAEKYDRVLEDIFAVQEELTTSIVRQIAPHIDATERERVLRRRPENLNAYELVVRARAYLERSFFQQDRALREEGLRDVRRALEIEPDNVQALCLLSRGIWMDIFSGNARGEQAWKDALDAATRAIELDRTNFEGYYARAGLLGMSKREGMLRRALEDARRAHELNPNHAQALAILGWIEMFAGDYASAIQRYGEAARMSPRDPWAFFADAQLSFCYFLAGDYEKGVECGLRSIREAPTEGTAHHDVALCYVGLGEFGKAHAALEEARRHMPEFITAALNGKSVLHLPEARRKYTTFVRVAAGLENPSAAEALR
jgi:adenylate cyclase